MVVSFVSRSGAIPDLFSQESRASRRLIWLVERRIEPRSALHYPDSRGRRFWVSTDEFWVRISRDRRRVVRPAGRVDLCGCGNPFGHPDKRVLARIGQYVDTDKILRTDENEQIVIETDGKTMWVRNERSSRARAHFHVLVRFGGNNPHGGDSHDTR